MGPYTMLMKAPTFTRTPFVLALFIELNNTIAKNRVSRSVGAKIK